MSSDYSLDFENINFRKNPELYKVGKGEQGVLLVQPYKSEILPYWRFKTPEIAEKSANKIYELYQEYKKANDFVGMDMARKYLQMGWTRSRRYANRKSGKKYNGPVPPDKKGQSGSHGRNLLPLDPDPIKAQSAQIFYEKYKKVMDDPLYISAKKSFLEKYKS